MLSEMLGEQMGLNETKTFFAPKTQLA